MTQRKVENLRWLAWVGLNFFQPSRSLLYLFVDCSSLITFSAAYFELLLFSIHPSIFKWVCRFQKRFHGYFSSFFSFSFTRRETTVCKVFAFSFSQRTLGNGVCCYFVFDFSCLRTFLTSTPFSMLSSVWWIRLEKSTLTTAFSIRLSFSSNAGRLLWLGRVGLGKSLRGFLELHGETWRSRLAGDTVALLFILCAWSLSKNSTSCLAVLSCLSRWPSMSSTVQNVLNHFIST